MNTNVHDDDDDDVISGDSSIRGGSPDTCDITSLDAEGNGSTGYSSGIETPPTNMIMNDIIMHHENEEGDVSANIDDNDINTNKAQLQNNIDDMDVAVSMAYNDINEEVIDDDNFQCEWFSTFYLPLQYMPNYGHYDRQKGETFYWKGVYWSVLFCLNEQNSNYGGGGLFIGYESFDADKSKSIINIRYQFLLMDENEQPFNLFGVTCKLQQNSSGICICIYS